MRPYRDARTVSRDYLRNRPGMPDTTGRAGRDKGGEMILSPLDKRRSIGLTEAARVLGIPPRTLRRHAGEGAIPGAFRIGKRRSHWRFRTDILEYWFEPQGAGTKNGGGLYSSLCDTGQGFVIGTASGSLRSSGITPVCSAA